LPSFFLFFEKNYVQTLKYKVYFKWLFFY